MYCTNCQHSPPKGAKFCPQCGSEVYQSKNRQPLKEGISSTSSTKPVNAYLMVAAAIAGALLVVFLILESNQKAVVQKKETSSKTQDNFQEIKVQLEKLNQDPESITLNVEMGNLLFDSGRFDEAIPFYQKSLLKDSNNIAVQIDMAVCYFNLKKIDQAIVEMEKALDIDSNHPKGLFNMGIIYYNLGDFDKVREYWQRLILLHPDLIEAKRAQEMLNALK